MLNVFLHVLWISFGACVLISHEERSKLRDAAVEKIWNSLKESRKDMLISDKTKSCKTIAEYKIDPALYTDKWQCENDTSLNFIKSKGMYFDPHPSVLNGMKTYYGLTDAELSALDLYGGISESVKGKWCGMPGPGNQLEYWNKCVMQRSGYFNVAYCDSPTTQAKLGIAALGPNVCYPPHNHHSNERYWQIAGNSVWRAWVDGNDAAPVVFPGKAGEVRYHPDKTTHEMETKDGNENFMLSEYWWAKNTDITDNDYKYCESCQGTCMNRQKTGGQYDCKSVAN